MRNSDYDYPIDDEASPIAVCNFNAIGGHNSLFRTFSSVRPRDFELNSAEGIGDDHFPMSN